MNTTSIMTPQQSQLHRTKFLDEARRYLHRDHHGVVAVLKAHLFAEQMLNAVLQSNLAIAEKELEACRLSFSQKLRLVVASENLSASVEKSLMELNAVRNKCAHRFDFDLAREHWNGIFEPFVAEMPYADPIPEPEDQKWLRWSLWVLGLMFPTADAYRNGH